MLTLIWIWFRFASYSSNTHSNSHYECGMKVKYDYKDLGIPTIMHRHSSCADRNFKERHSISVAYEAIVEWIQILDSKMANFNTIIICWMIEKRIIRMMQKLHLIEKSNLLFDFISANAKNMLRENRISISLIFYYTWCNI